MTTVKIRENFLITYKNNPISGYAWPEHGPTKSFYVIGASGIFSRHLTLKKAQKAQKELQDFYNKFNL